MRPRAETGIAGELGIDIDRLERLLGGEDLAWLVSRVRRRLARGQALTGVVQLDRATAQQRSAVERLLGSRPRSGQSVSVDLEQMDRVIRGSGAAAGLEAAVIALGGPVHDEAATAAALEAGWKAAYLLLEQDTRPVLAGWRSSIRSTGQVKRVVGTPQQGAALLADVLKVVTALPAAAEPRGRLAARLLGSPHALDDGRPVTSLVFGAARVLSGLVDGQGAKWRRDVWSAVGVLPDDLSSSVLLLGFPGDRKLPLGRVLEEWKSVGEPVSVTLRQLRAPEPVELEEALGIDPGQEVYVCENPVVVSTAADSLGSRCAPLVCISGQPGVAAQVLLRRLASTGAKLRYHGDFDWGGVRIANGAIGNFGSTPWRMDVGSYRTAVALGCGRPLEGDAVQASWDPELALAMSEHLVGVDEEHVLDGLMSDLCR